MRLPRILLGALLIGLGVESAAARTVGVPWGRCFDAAAKLHDVPAPLLVAVARTESALDPAARSHADAHGLMQIQWPGTARHLGVRRVAALYEPCLNIELGARYLRELLDRYDGDRRRALAAYNYGPGRIARSGPIPAGAERYVARVEARVAAPVDAPAFAGMTLPLALFDHQARARALAAHVNGLLDRPQVRIESGRFGHRAVLAVPSAGLDAHALATLQRLGLVTP